MTPTRRNLRFVLRKLAITLLLSGCATSDLANFSLGATHSNQLVQGEPFLHRTLFKAGQGEYLHVYIEGDGRPWITPRSKSSDPTPNNPLALQLMAKDAAPTLYLGRPCYFDTGDALCSDDQWWTSHRYAAQIVQSMNVALDPIAANYRGIHLIGYSGGGSLAYLMSAQRDDVVGLLTLAANLDINAWTDLHGYTPLRGSLNPASFAPLSTSVRQVHYWGELDSNVPRSVIATAVGEDEHALIRMLADADHRCCWVQDWDVILAGFLNP